MPVTIHVNGTSNSLVHKGSMGIAKNTVPDVCKTPSPGGPIPIPYPVIISLSKDLAKGTKTVKVDGGQPAAIKGSEFSRCTGDEPGTAGGVISSTNMKEATWITYSFDVKLDGKNACRLADKMMMNHGNTVCLGGEMQAPVTRGIEIKCKEEWDECQKKQMCTKVESLNKSAPLTKKKVTPAIKMAKKKYQAKYRQENPPPGGNWTDDCAKTNGKPVDADHVTDVQWGGDVKGPFEYLDMSVNRSIGKQMDLSKVDPVENFTAHPNCGC